MFLEVYLFNWTNPGDLDQYPNVKPNFEEVGPYVFHEVHERVNLIWNSNDTITFNQRRTWHFDPDRSKGSLDDTITNLNVISLVSVQIIHTLLNIQISVIMLIFSECCIFLARGRCHCEVRRKYYS